MEIEAVWSQKTDLLLKNMGSNLSTGLTEHQVTAARTRFGKNSLIAESSLSHLTLILRQLKNPMVYTLTFATIVAFALGENIDGFAILIIVILNASIGYAQESKATAAIEALKKLSVPKARVLRESKIISIDSKDVLPGDILHLEAGDYIVADARIIEAYQLYADEATLTGESLPVEKQSVEIKVEAPLAERSNMLYAGTALSSGSGKAVVTSIGMKTEIGHIAGLLKTTEQIATPLQNRLEKVSKKLVLLGFIVIIAVVILGRIQGDDWFSVFMSAISLAVAAIPEGLPTIVTLALTLAVGRMTKRNALVRNMSAVETLGSTDIICTDKTGTLTTGKMRVREMFTLEESCVDEKEFKGEELIFKALVLCNNASLEHGGSGDTTELSLLHFAQAHSVDITQLAQDNPRFHEWSFESERKRMSVAIVSGDKVMVFCKGAPETLLPLCILTAKQMADIDQATLELSDKGRRLLAIAYKEVSDKNISQLAAAEIEKDLKFLGLVSIADPPKADVIESIKQCKAAGIKVVMITGDHPRTANAIAHELNISDEGTFDQVLTGAELNSMAAEELRLRVEKTAVYARVTPEHKLKIIEALQANGHIVAMTGDGVNDAPALKKASIGVAMGKGGTEVARQASAMVLTDDNFSTIVSAVEEGRAIFGNIKRTIQYLLSTNLAEIFVMLGSMMLGFPMPLNPLSLLWINIVTDGFPSLALAAEPVAKDFLKTSARPSPVSFFDKRFMRELFLVAVVMTIIIIYVYHHTLLTSDPMSAKSYVFTLLVYMSLFRSFSSRSEDKFFFQLSFNPWHLSSVLIPVILQVGLQHTKLFQKLFHVRALSLSENGMLLLLGLIPLTLLEIQKIWRRR